MTGNQFCFLRNKSVSLCTLTIILIAALLILSSCSFENGQIGSTNKCYDVDNDHKCDVCQSVMTNCPTDTKRDHICDICQTRFSNCYDNDDSHFCDYCGMPVFDCKDENNDHFCDFCKLELTECQDFDKNHICDICKDTIDKCSDISPADHICDWCGARDDGCLDTNRDHSCDICLAVLSECGDDNKDHLCDICEVVVSQCTDQAKRYICDICGMKLPYISMTAPDDCLINNNHKEDQFTVGGSMRIQLSYVGLDDRQVVGWIIYNADNVEIARILPSEIYTIEAPGYYHATPVFQ